MLLPTFWPLLADNDCGFFAVIMLRILWNPERNERRLVWRFCVKAHHHYHSIIIIAKAAHFRTWIMRNPEAAWVVLMDFSVLRQVPLMIITFFFTSHEIQKKKQFVISTPCSNLWNNVFKTLKMKTLASSNFLNWKPKVLFLNGHNDLTNQTYNWIFLFQNCTHFSICRNFKEANYCMQFSPLFVCLSVCLSLLLFFDCFFCVQKLLLVRKEKLEP